MSGPYIGCTGQRMTTLKISEEQYIKILTRKTFYNNAIILESFSHFFHLLSPSSLRIRVRAGLPRQDGAGVLGGETRARRAMVRSPLAPLRLGALEGTELHHLIPSNGMPSLGYRNSVIFYPPPQFLVYCLIFDLITSSACTPTPHPLSHLTDPPPLNNPPSPLCTPS